MPEIERDGDDVLIRMKAEDLEDLTNILQKTGNASCRERNRYPSGSLMYELKLKWANAAWAWAENLSTPPNSSHTFTVEIK